MDVLDILTQLEEGIGNGNYHCCDVCFNSFYDFRKHLFENHPEEYEELEPYLHRERPKQLTKEEIHQSIKAIRKKKEAFAKKRHVREKLDYSKQPTAWIIYHHNGSKK